MKVWVDADACPKPVKEILFRMAKRTQITIILVSNQLLFVPASPFIQKIQVRVDFDGADKYILENMKAKDLIITADILLADAVINQEGTALNPRGTLYTTRNMKQNLSLRNLNTELRSAGKLMGGPSGITKKEIQTFSNNLDKYLTSFRQS